MTIPFKPHDSTSSFRATRWEDAAEIRPGVWLALEYHGKTAKKPHFVLLTADPQVPRGYTYLGTIRPSHGRWKGFWYANVRNYNRVDYTPIFEVDGHFKMREDAVQFALHVVKEYYKP